MKKLSIILAVGFLLLIGLLVGCGSDEKTTQEADSNKVKVSSSIDDMHSNFEISGKECKEIENTKERGNCFRSVNEKYLMWMTDDTMDVFTQPIFNFDDGKMYFIILSMIPMN